MSRFVRPDHVTLTLANGDTLVVKRRLNTGEQQEAYARMTVAGGLKVDPLRVGIVTVTAYLLDWSLTDDDDQPVPIRGLSMSDLTAVVHALDHESFLEIRDAIVAHDAAVAVQRIEEKKILGGASSDGSISRSRSGVAGGSGGSVN